MNIIIDRFEGDKAVIILPNDQKVVISRSDLPENAKESDSLKLVFVGDDVAKLSGEDQAKAILNEILKSNA